MSEALKQKQEFDHTIRNYDDTTTWLAEVLDGHMRTEFSYTFDGQELIARDGSALGPIFDSSIADAKQKAQWDKDFEFEVRRRQIEREEYDAMVAMARSELPNTMVVVSDFPEEVLNLGQDTGGYNTVRRQTMLRVISKLEDGSLRMVSQSLDRSDRQSLEALYDFMKIPVQRGELLGQRMYVELDPALQANLPETLTRVYDTTLANKYGGEWYAGRCSADRRNTMDFALGQHDLLNAYLSGPRDQRATYNLSAAITSRFEKSRNESESVTVPAIGSLTFISAAIEMEYHGRQAMKEGKTFSGCGATLSGTMEASGELSASGYGDAGKKSDSKSTDMKCVNCPSCRTFHEKVRKVAGKLVCDNPNCKLSDKKK